MLSEDTLLRHAQFVCDQVHNFDLAGDGNDPLITHPCLRTIVDLAGVTLGKKCALRAKLPRNKGMKKMPKWTKATVTPLVQQCFDACFADQLDHKTAKDENKAAVAQAPRRLRCGVCEACFKQDCGNCSSCKDMIKFGGTGTKKQCCKERKCPNMMLAEVEEEEDDTEKLAKLQDAATCARSHRIKKTSHKLLWVGDAKETVGKKTYYSSVSIDGEIVSRGDSVEVKADNKAELPYIARVISMWEDRRGDKVVHADWYCRGKDTILGDTSDPKELFMMDDCEDIPIESITKKVHEILS